MLSFHFVFDSYRNLSAPVIGRATNHAGEIQAAKRAIYRAGNYGWDAIHIITDSIYLIESVTINMDKWRTRGWTRTNGGPLANEDDFRDLDEAMDTFSYMKIYWEHVFAHSGVEGNEEADYLAKQGAWEYQNMWC